MRDRLTDKETARILRITPTKLYKVVRFFDKHDDDEWDLNEGEHFEYKTKSGDKEERDREFYEEGVQAIAEFLDKDTPGLVKRVMEALTHRRRRIKQTLVSRRITQELIESGSLVLVQGELGFVTKRTSISILQTNGKGINNSVNRLREGGGLEGQESLEINKHFAIHDDGEKIWSQKGIASIAVDMSENAALNKTRKAWVSAVGEVVEDCFKTEIKRLSGAPASIDKAIAKAKSACRKTCQVTGKRKEQGRELSLDGHHLFGRVNRPDLADLHENILVIESSIHTHFHSWKGGNGACEPKDFLDFLTNVRSELIEPTNASASKRYSDLVARITKLQKNYENFHLRYK